MELAPPQHAESVWDRLPLAELPGMTPVLCTMLMGAAQALHQPLFPTSPHWDVNFIAVTL